MRWSFYQGGFTEQQSIGLSVFEVFILPAWLTIYALRVVQPPADQRSRPRLGAFYFCLADDAVKLVPFVDSPVLQRVGIKRRFSDEQAPSMEAWRKGRTSAYGQTELKKGLDGAVEEEIINGVLVRHYS